MMRRRRQISIRPDIWPRDLRHRHTSTLSKWHMAHRCGRAVQHDRRHRPIPEIAREGSEVPMGRRSQRDQHRIHRRTEHGSEDDPMIGRSSSSFVKRPSSPIRVRCAKLPGEWASRVNSTMSISPIPQSTEPSPNPSSSISSVQVPSSRIFAPTSTIQSKPPPSRTLRWSGCVGARRWSTFNGPPRMGRRWSSPRHAPS